MMTLSLRYVNLIVYHGDADIFLKNFVAPSIGQKAVGKI